MTAPLDSGLAAIASAGIGWQPEVAAKMLCKDKPCRDCKHFEMRVIRANETDTFGHLLPYCTNPMLPGYGWQHGDGWQQTQTLSTCDHWSAK